MAVPLLLFLTPLPVSHPAPHQGDDLAHQARAQAESLKDALKSFSTNQKANELLGRLRNHTNTCFNNIDDVIETIETNTKLVENVAEDIDDLLDRVELFVWLINAGQ